MDITKINPARLVSSPAAEEVCAPKLPEISGYKLTRRIGQGGMASVYHAIEMAHNRRVALKVLSEQSAGVDDSLVERFRREANAGFQLSHKNVVAVFSHGSEGGLHYIAMDLMRGGSLRDRLNQGLKIQTGLVIIKELADALDYLIAKGIVHRDIKPDNVLFRDRDDTPLLADFGIAHQLNSGLINLTQHGSLQYVGSPKYMSPERFDGQMPDIRSELYSLGVVLYEILAGRAPFTCALNDFAVIANGHKHNPVPLLPAGVRCFQRVIEKVLAKRPQDRYQSGSELIAALDAVPFHAAELTNLSARDNSATVLSRLDAFVVHSGLMGFIPGWRTGKFWLAGVYCCGFIAILAVTAVGFYPRAPQTGPASAKPVALAQLQPPAPKQEPKQEPGREIKPKSEPALELKSPPSPTTTMGSQFVEGPVPAAAPAALPENRQPTATAANSNQAGSEERGQQAGLARAVAAAKARPGSNSESEQKDQPDPLIAQRRALWQTLDAFEVKPGSLSGQLQKRALLQDILALTPDDESALRQRTAVEDEIARLVTATIKRNDLDEARSQIHLLVEAGVSDSVLQNLNDGASNLEARMTAEAGAIAAMIGPGQPFDGDHLANVSGELQRLEKKYAGASKPATAPLRRALAESYTGHVEALIAAGKFNEAESTLVAMQDQGVAEADQARLGTAITNESRKLLDNHQQVVSDLIAQNAIDEAAEYFSRYVRDLNVAAGLQLERQRLADKIGQASGVMRLVNDADYYQALDRLENNRQYFETNEYRALKEYIDILMIGDSI